MPTPELRMLFRCCSDVNWLRNMDFGSNFRQHRGYSTRFNGIHSFFPNKWEIFWMFRCSDVLVQNQTNQGIHQVQQTYKTLTRCLCWTGLDTMPRDRQAQRNIGTSEHRNITEFQDDITQFFLFKPKSERCLKVDFSQMSQYLHKWMIRTENSAEHSSEHSVWKGNLGTI